jgi:integrase/recombinase XerD
MVSNSKSRTVTIFEEYIQSEQTIFQYTYHINRFANYYNLSSWDSILALNNADLKEKVEDYVILFKNNDKSLNYIRVITFAIQSLCDSNDKLGINWKKIRKLLGKKTKPQKTRPYTTDEIKRMLSVTKGLRNKALILFLSSSGVRRGGFPEMRIRDLKQMSHGCLAVTVYANTDEEYVTFINKEASEALSHYHNQRKHRGEKLTPDSLVFRAFYKNVHDPIKKLNEQMLSNVILRMKNNATVNTENLPNILVHAFRRRFNTVLKLNDNANPTLIERLMGHDQKLDNSYFQPTLEQLFEEYQKGMADLTIDDSHRLLAERELMQAELTELQQEQVNNKELANRMSKYEDNQLELLEVMNLIKSGHATLKNSPKDEVHVVLNP